MRLLALTGLVAVVLTGGCNCRGKGSDKSGSSDLPPPPPLVKYVNQVVGGKYIAPLPPPAVVKPATLAGTLPDLPPLSAHGKSLPPPPKAKGEHPCGSARVGDKMVPLDCMDPDYAKIEHATQPLVGSDVLHGREITLPAVVDHRAEGTEGPVRDQGESPDCTAFSMAAAVDHSVNRWVKVPIHVSVMQIWARYHMSNMARADFANTDKPLAPDSDWPYSDRTATSWLSPDLCRVWGLPPSTCGKPVDQSKLSQLEARGIAQIDDVARVDNAKDTHEMKVRIAAGQDIWIGIHVGNHFSCGKKQCSIAGKPGAKYIQDYADPASAGHAVVIAGYATLPHSTYFLIHNSWGTGWGDSGYAWIHEDTLRKNIGEAYIIDADPMDQTGHARERRAGGNKVCGKGLSHDSLSGQCVPPCPDGSPRHNAICPVANQCAAGFVNLTGTCVLAAPTKNAVDPRTKISFQCGPGGCSYVVPNGVGGCDVSGGCSMSCPAPDFRIAQSRDGLACIE